MIKKKKITSNWSLLKCYVNVDFRVFLKPPSSLYHLLLLLFLFFFLVFNIYTFLDMYDLPTEGANSALFCMLGFRSDTLPTTNIIWA